MSTLQNGLQMELSACSNTKIFLMCKEALHLPSWSLSISSYNLSSLSEKKPSAALQSPMYLHFP